MVGELAMAFPYTQYACLHAVGSSTTYFYNQINVTSKITAVTQYVNTTITNYSTKVTTANGTASMVNKVGTNGIGLIANLAPGPTDISVELQGSVTVTGSITV